MRKNCAIICSGLSTGFAILFLIGFTFFFVQECCGPSYESPADRNVRMHSEKEVLSSKHEKNTEALNLAVATQQEKEDIFNYVSGHDKYDNSANPNDVDNGSSLIEVDLKNAQETMEVAETAFFEKENTKNFFIEKRDEELEDIATQLSLKEGYELDIEKALAALDELNGHNAGICTPLPTPAVDTSLTPEINECVTVIPEYIGEDGVVVAEQTVAIEEHNPISTGSDSSAALDKPMNEEDACTYQQWRVQVAECKLARWTDLCYSEDGRNCDDFFVAISVQDYNTDVEGGVKIEEDLEFTSVEWMNLKIGNMEVETAEYDAAYESAKIEYERIYNMDTSTEGLKKLQKELMEANENLRITRYQWGEAHFGLMSHIAEMKGGSFKRENPLQVQASDSNSLVIAKNGHWYANGIDIIDSNTSGDPGTVGVIEDEETGDVFTVSSFYYESTDRTEFYVERIDSPSFSDQSPKGWSSDKLRLGMLAYREGVCVYQQTSDSEESPDWNTILPGDENADARKLMAAMHDAGLRRELSAEARPMDCYDRSKFLMFFGIGGLALVIVAVLTLACTMALNANEEAVSMQLPGMSMRRPKPVMSMAERERKIKNKINKKYQDKLEIESAKLSAAGSNNSLTGVSVSAPRGQMVGNPQYPMASEQPQYVPNRAPFGLR